MIFDALGRIVATTATYEPVTVAVLEANAAAIVAAVNAAEAKERAA